MKYQVWTHDSASITLIEAESVYKAARSYADGLSFDADLAPFQVGLYVVGEQSDEYATDRKTFTFAAVDGDSGTRRSLSRHQEYDVEYKETKIMKIMTLMPKTTDGPMPLFHQFAGQSSPQHAYLELDCCAKTLIADWTGEVGNAVPESVFRGFCRRYDIPAELSGDEIAGLLIELKPLAERVVAGFSLTGQLDEIAVLNNDAEAAEAAIAALIEDLPEPVLSFCDPGSFFEYDTPAQIDRRLAQVNGDCDALARDLRDEAIVDNIVIDVDDISEWLESFAWRSEA